MDQSSFWISLGAIAVMLYCLWLVLSLKNRVPGGMVGRKWSTLTMMVAMFTLGYLATPFAGAVPEDAMRLIVSLIFFFGAIYVVLTVKLLFAVIEELTG